MKITFQTPKVNEEAIREKIEKHVRRGDYGAPTVRPHKNNDVYVVFELMNYAEGIIPDFEVALKQLERKKVIGYLKITNQYSK